MFDLGSVAILRLLRLLRVCRVLHSFPALRAVVNSLLLACTNVLHLFFLIALVNFVVACVGMLLFRANDPHNFGTLIAALISVWMVETLDEWEGPYYSLVSRAAIRSRFVMCVCVGASSSSGDEDALVSFEAIASMKRPETRSGRGAAGGCIGAQEYEITFAARDTPTPTIAPRPRRNHED